MKMSPLGAEIFFQADGRTNGGTEKLPDIMKLIVFFEFLSRHLINIRFG